MSLPIITLPMAERWDCHQCGVCCRGSIVPLDEEDLRKLQEQKWEEHSDYRGVAVTAAGDRRGRKQLAKRVDGSCVFLMDDGLCRIHKEFGFDAKPLVCRMFPLQLVPRDKQAVLTIRRACPSAAADKGREVTEYLPEVRAYAKEGRLIEHAVAAPPIKPGEEAEWKRSGVLLETLRRVTCDERYPPIRRLVHGLELCRLVETARTGGMPTRKLSDLVSVLEEHIAAEAAPHFAQRQRPSAGGRLLFRRIGLEAVRLHPRAYLMPRWWTRFQLVWWALKMVAGRGTLPRVHPQFPSATFQQLEQPLGLLDAALYRPLARYFETSTASYQYALGDRGGWSIIESYRQLAILYPIALWLLRWATVGRTPEVNDVYEIITTLERAQGYAPLGGLEQRSRLRTLARLDDLPRLVIWYGQ
jgi:lysine-N-methylase